MREVEKEVMLEHWIRSDECAESKKGKVYHSILKIFHLLFLCMYQNQNQNFGLFL